MQLALSVVFFGSVSLRMKKCFFILVDGRDTVRNSLGRVTGSSGSLGLYYRSLLQYAAGWKMICTNFKRFNEFAIMIMSFQRELS